MKKIILSLFALVALLVSLPQFFADEVETGNLVVHFKKWDDNYQDLGSYNWGANVTHKLTYDALDDFGAVFNFNNVPVVAADNTETIGFIAVSRPGGGDPDWNSKYTADINIARTVVQANKTTHVYVFQGTENSSADDPRYYVADPDKFNMLLVYFDPTGNYEENLGVHNWSGWSQEASGWGTPLKVFSTAGETAAGVKVKAGMLSAAPAADDAVPGAGLLIYAGGDANKKTGDVTLQGAFGEGTHAVGDTAFAWVVSKGDAYTANDNLFYGLDAYADFAEDAFSFKLMPFQIDSKTGQFNGTYAPRPTQIIVKLSASVTNIYAEAEEADEKEDAMETMVGWFVLKQKTGENTFGNAIALERVDFSVRAASLTDFVVVLPEATPLDNTKEYVLFYNDGTNEAEIAVAMDTQAPVITFPLLDEDGVVIVAWGQPFNLDDFPLYEANDDRDGNLTQAVYVPAGPNSILDTRTEGDYVIKLQVEDTWGNVGEVTFTFRVTKSAA